MEPCSLCQVLWSFLWTPWTCFIGYTRHSDQKTSFASWHFTTVASSIVLWIEFSEKVNQPRLGKWTCKKKHVQIDFQMWRLNFQLAPQKSIICLPCAVNRLRLVALCSDGLFQSQKDSEACGHRVALEILVFGVEGLRIQQTLSWSVSLLNVIEITSLIQKSELFSRWMNLGSLSLYFFRIVLCLCKKGAPWKISLSTDRLQFTLNAFSVTQ